ncbi:MAG: N-acetylglucosamine-6-phosphate deacetylase [Candidatus Coproplasma sp.]
MRYVYSDSILIDGRFRKGCVSFENGVICKVSEQDTPPVDGEVFDATGMYVTPAFIDMHTHGALGEDFTFCTPEGVVKAVNYHFRHGTATILPTTLASDREGTLAALSAIKEAKGSKDLLGEIAGVHIEGPYFAPSMAGAQNPEYLTDPIEADYRLILDKFGDLVKKWSYAPERDKGARFARYLIEHGVLPSAGHTQAKYEDFSAAYAEGLRSVTHLYSCTSTITRENGFRKLGVIECAYLYEDVCAELIADGKHIPPELIKMVFRLKGADTIALVTDSLSITGTDALSGELNGVPYIVEDGVAKLADRSAFAGSIATADRLIAQCVQAGVPLEQAVISMTQTPARLLGIKKGELRKEYDADIAVFDKEYNVVRMYSHGECRYKA